MGGYTTFSTLAYETAAIFQEGGWRRAGFYALGSLVLGLVVLMLDRAVGSCGAFCCSMVAAGLEPATPTM